MKPCTRLTCSLVATLVVACVLSLQGTGITLSPSGPALLVGQSLQLSAGGAIVPVQLSSGAWHTCVMYSDQSIRCTGLNNQGEIGNNSWISVSEPQLSQNLVNPTTLLTGNEHTCTWITDGRMQCWGTNYTGQLGDGTIGGFATTAQFVHNIPNAIKGVTGGYHTCAILADSSVQCWGRNQDGQIGNGDATTDITLPTPVANLGAVADLFAGGYHTCAVMADRTARCWGRNGRGQVGDGTDISPVTQPHAVVGLSGINVLRLGGYHSCALLQDATVQCWGQSDYGQIGSPGAFAATPVTVPGLTGVTQLAAGMRHTCAVAGDGLVRCWGQNDWGQLGDQTTTSSSTPVLVQGIANPRQITAGWGHSCALMADASVWCWGENDYGELGVGTVVNSPVPVKMHGTGVTWTSDTPSVATVDATGVVTGVSRGTATITVTDPFGNSGSATVVVREMLSLAVSAQGDGSGAVTSAPGGVNCPGTCAASFISDSQVTLTAAAGDKSTFAGWVACDSISGPACTVTMSAARSVAATFNLQRFPLSVSISRTLIGTGTVTSAPSGISCGADCSESFVIGTTVTLTATPGLGSFFTGWTGCDTSSGSTCTVAVGRARAVTAAFIGL